MHSGTGLGIDLHPPNHFSGLPGVPPTRFQGAGTRTMQPGESVRRRLCATASGEDQPQTLVTMRSAKGMAGLLLAETGGSMVEIDKHSGRLGSNFREGRHIEPGAVTPIGKTRSDLPPSSARGSRIPSRLRPKHRRGMSLDQGLARSGTLLSVQASPTRRAAELKVLLGDSSAKLKSGALVSTLQGQNRTSPTAVAFEQGRSRVRVALDLILENNIIVEGGCLSGCVLLHIRPKGKGDLLSLGGGKIRVAGFEVTPGNEDRHIFYQVAAPLMDISGGCDGLYAGSVDSEGFGSVGEGEYRVHFSLKLPIISSGGKPKGVMITRAGAMIRYIVIASMKVVDPNTGKRSIAHFYRDCEVWPALDPVITLAPAPQLIYAHTAKSIFMGGDGELALSAALHRITWVAGQPAHVRVRIVNDTRKTVRSVSLALIRTTTLFRPSTRLSGFGGDQDSCETETSERRVAEAVLAAGQKGAKGHASAKGWWTGVASGESAVLGHSITIPADALTIQRARLLESEYTLRVSLGVGSLTGSSDAIHVVLPIRIVNPISLDPPPSGPLLSSSPMSSSMTEMKTPRPADSLSACVSTGSWLEDADMPDSADTLERVQYKPRSLTRTHVPLSALPTVHTLHDLGSVEDADDLHGLLGEIPGSASFLEASDISAAVDSGYSDGEYDSYENLEEQMYDSYEEEEIESDEELERMVGCASARIDMGAFQLSGGTARHGLPKRARDNTKARQYASDTESHRIAEVSSERAIETPQSRNIQGIVYAPRGSRNYNHRAATSPQRQTFAERVHKKLSGHASLERVPEHDKVYAGNMCPTTSMLHVPDKSGRLLDESPQSVYSVQAQTVDNSPLWELKDSPSRSSKPQGPRPTVPRALTAPADETAHGLSGIGSTLSSLLTNLNVSEAAGCGMSSVRERIALLEQRGREKDSHFANDMSTSPSRPGIVTRSMTSLSIYSDRI